MINLSKKVEDKKYCEQCVGGTRNRDSNVVELDEGLEWSVDYDLFEIPVIADAYTSVYTYKEEMAEHVKKTKSVRGYEGPVYTGFIHWDFDSEIEVGSAQKDVLELLSRIEDIGIDVDESCRIYYSGEQ